jgi:hypothetical protein
MRAIKKISGGTDQNMLILVQIIHISTAPSLLPTTPPANNTNNEDKDEATNNNNVCYNKTLARSGCSRGLVRIPVSIEIRLEETLLAMEIHYVA